MFNECRGLAEMQRNEIFTALCAMLPASERNVIFLTWGRTPI